VARFVDVNYNLTLGDAAPLAQQWSPLVNTTGDHEDFKERFDSPSRRNVLQFLLFDQENPNSIISCINKARESARTVREVLPAEIWEHLNRFRMLVHDASKSNKALEHPYDFCESVRMASHLTCGIAESSMLHDEAWSFLQTGRLIERADKTSRIVDVQYFLLLPKVTDVGTSLDINRWSSLLRSADALNMYRRARGRITPSKVAQFLILNPIFPRSMLFCVSKTQECLLKMNQTGVKRDDLESEKRLKQLVDRVSTIEIEEIIEQGMHNFIDQFQGALNAIGTAVHKDYFNTQIQQRRLAADEGQVKAGLQSQS
jgi:uncharacterized alpha-E superfamily protein